MFELKIITEFAAAHRLRNFQGKCEQLHGFCMGSDQDNELNYILIL